MSETVDESTPGNPDITFWVHRSLTPGEEPCEARSQGYGYPVPHNREFGSYGLCQACEGQYRDWFNPRRRVKPPISLRLRYFFERRRWKQEKAVRASNWTA